MLNTENAYEFVRNSILCFLSENIFYQSIKVKSENENIIAIHLLKWGLTPIKKIFCFRFEKRTICFNYA